MKVAIVVKDGIMPHSTSWVIPWEEYCQQNCIEYGLVDIMSVSSIDVLRYYDVLLWHFGQYNYTEMLEARSILYSAKKWV